MRAVVLRNGRLEVRETDDPVPGRGQLLLRTRRSAICASDVHFMDHPETVADDDTGMFGYDPDRDIVMGHEFVGEVVGHGPGTRGRFPLGTRVTSLPLLDAGDGPHIIGAHPAAPGAFGQLMLVSEERARAVPDSVPDDAVALVDAFAVGEFYVAASGIAPGEIPLVLGAGAIGLSAVAALVARHVEPVLVADYNRSRLELARSFGAHVVVDPAEVSPHARWREEARRRGTSAPPVVFECVGVPGVLEDMVTECEPGSRIFVAGGWFTGDRLSVPRAMRKGVVVHFGGGPLDADWYGTLDAVCDGRLDPRPSIGMRIGLDDVPRCIDLVRRGEGPPRVVVLPNG